MLAGPGSPSPKGMELVWAVLWLGVVYGAVDALLLTVMPVYAPGASASDPVGQARGTAALGPVSWHCLPAPWSPQPITSVLRSSEARNSSSR